jgi:hypothetical protein
MIDVTELVGTVFSGLSALVIEDVEDAGNMICVRARTRDGVRGKPGVTPTARQARTSSAVCPWTTQHDGPQRYKVTRHGTEKKRPV